MPSKEMKFEEGKELLQQMREDNSRSSEIVLDIWENCIGANINKFGDEKWIVYEQIVIAALDLARLDVAQECIQQLNKQFPDSMRVRKLKAMQFEVMEHWDDALKIYDALLEIDDSNCALHKRKIAVLRSQNLMPEAIKHLNDYLKKFMCDHEAWSELCELYLMEQDYNKALFCMEELLLSNPHNHLYHQQYADIQYTAGNIDLSRPYYARALQLNPSNSRALFGLYLTTIKSSSTKKKENLKYSQWCSNKISNNYKEAMCDDKQMSCVTELLSSLNVNNSS